MNRKLVYFASFGASEKNIYQLCVSICSVLHFNRSSVDLLVYCDSETAALLPRSLGEELMKEVTLWIGKHQYTDIYSEASWARYEIFQWPEINSYSTILYLDTDTIVSGSLQELTARFDDPRICRHPLAALAEGGLIEHQNEDTQYHGGDLLRFYQEHKLEEGATTFTTGILLFRNCAAVKDLFASAMLVSRRYQYDFLKSNQEWPHFFSRCDQPTINYLAIRNRIVDCDLFSGCAENNPPQGMPLIAHFPGGLGNPDKVAKMNSYLDAHDFRLGPIKLDLALAATHYLRSQRINDSISFALRLPPESTLSDTQTHDGSVRPESMSAGDAPAGSQVGILERLGQGMFKARLSGLSYQALSSTDAGGDEISAEPETDAGIVTLIADNDCGNAFRVIDASGQPVLPVVTIGTPSFAEIFACTPEQHQSDQPSLNATAADPLLAQAASLQPSSPSISDADLFEARFRMKSLIAADVVQRLRNQHGDRILHGPFRGVIYKPAVSTWGDDVLKLLGLYEHYLHPVIYKIQAMCRAYPLIDLGCAEGYYAAGMAKILGSKSILISDISSDSIETCRQLLAENEIDANIHVASRASAEVLIQFLSDRPQSVVICDIEGDERELFSDQRLIDSLRRSHLLIELHEFVDRGVQEDLIGKFAETHTSTVIREIDLQPSSITELRDLPGFERFIVCCETRPELMGWLYLTPRPPV